jgi:cytochrome c oxidase subunit 4
MSSEPHVLSIRTNVTIFVILLALLVLTVAVAYVDLGPLGLPVAMAIATVKAALILMYFMHVKFNPPLVWIFSTAAFFWLLILLAFSFNDFLTRGWLSFLGK